jgi:hypothetical protein
MASLRPGTRRDGSTYVQVLYRLDGKQSSTSFEDLASAQKFQKFVEKFGPAKALETLGGNPEISAITVHEWIEHHIDHLTGLRKSSLYDYRSYLKNDIDEALGDLPLTSLSRDDIARWMQGLSEKGASGKTVANKHGFLSSALNAAVRAGRITSNPAAGQRLPRSERQESSASATRTLPDCWGASLSSGVRSSSSWWHRGAVGERRPRLNRWTLIRLTGPCGSPGPGSGPMTEAATS